MKTMRTRALISTAEELDANLVKIQDEEHEIIKIQPFNEGARADTMDTGHGKGELDFYMIQKFIIFYLERVALE